MIQGGEGLRVTGSAPAGGSVTVNIGPNDSSIQITVGGSGKSEDKPVDPNKDVDVPVPNVPPGTVIIITVGSGLRARTLEITVIAPSP